MKTPEEIEKGLETCIGKCTGNKPHCPYHSCGDGCMDSMHRDAIALIQQIEAQVPKWSDAKSNPPKKSGKYLVWIKCEKGTWAEEGDYAAEEAEWSHDRYHDGFAEVSTDFVTHWMPLPEPPKEEEK